MSKLIVAAALVVSLVGTASAAGWRSLRLDARDEASFTQSVAVLQKELSLKQWYVLRVALNDIWDQGTKNAAAEQREYTSADYLRQLDGLGYKEIVTFTDPSGKTARRNAKAYDPYLAGDLPPRTGWPVELRGPSGVNSPPSTYQSIGFSGEQLHGSPDLSDHRP